jgi:hypothetical protein
MTKTIETIKQIQEIAKNNQANLELRVVKLPHLKAGECYRQGDLYIFKVPNDFPVGKKLDRRQLADGQSIGQRHVLLGDFQVYEGVKAPVKFKDDIYERAGAIGYAFDVLGECTNAHPEHSHFVFTQKGRYQVCHQVDFQTLQRVAD